MQKLQTVDQGSNPRTVRILAMSDTHDTHHKINVEQLPKADIFIHAGDFTKFSGKQQLDRFRQFMTSLPYKHKLVIAGNHDFALDKDAYTSHLNKKHGTQPLDTDEEIKKMQSCCTYLQHEMVQVEGVRIFGSPYSPQFFDWGFMYAPHQSQELWSKIPKDIDVLITHGPPYGILDQTHDKVKAGCKGLLSFVQKLKPKVHIFGHIHEAYGNQKVGQTNFYNASMVNLQYKLVNKAFLIQLQVKDSTPKESDKISDQKE